ncbi:hypothetical protein NEIG_01632 [Nematocida sp. ERTm5]|nr:hypothetical protein NEIG_01632 [Nematocida sp. ERTm5]
MKLEMPNRVIKNILFIPRMKKGMIILKLLLVMYTVCARLELKDIKTISDSVVIEEDNLLIHPGGALNPLRGYIMHRSGYMYNKRFYASEIDTDYSLIKTDEVTYDDIPIYDYTREPINDEIYSDIYEDIKKNQYLTQFHALLVKMFPSRDGSLSIVSGRQDSIYSFFVKDRVKPECMRIMAALFLLSEQVNIPFIIEKKKKEKKLILKSADEITTYIELPRTNEILLRVIEFLKKNIGNDSVNPSEMEALPTEPNTYKEFETGEFLNTLQFLVQSYIYEFIDKKENYIEFVKAVHTFLNDQIINEKSTEENKARCNELLEKLFIEKSSQLSITNHTEHIHDLNEVIDTYRVCPFINKTELPTYTRVKAYDRTTGKEIDDEARKYSNCVEAGILGLMCCLVYDKVKREYNTDHLPDSEETKPLKQFFQDHPRPRETTSCEMQQDWCKVVADLKNKKIVYEKKGNTEEKTNELDSSLLNILYVVSDITGNDEKVLKEIEKIESMCSNKEDGALLNVQECLTEIFTALSNNKGLEVKSESFTINKKTNGELCLLGSFSLIYSFEKIKNGITIGIAQNHTSLGLIGDLFSSEDKKIICAKLTEIQNEYRNTENYTECIIRHYLSVERIKIEKANIFHVNSIRNVILDSIRAGDSNLLRLFLYGRIESVDQKVYIITHFLLFYVMEPQKNNSLIVRLTSNLIGSAPLSDQETRKWALMGHLFNPDAKRYYTRIEGVWEDNTMCDKKIFSAIFVFLSSALSRIEDDFLEAFGNLMKKVGTHENVSNIVMDSYKMTQCIIHFLDYTNQSRVNALCEVMNIAKESLTRMNKRELTNLYLVWFFIISSQDIENRSELLKCIFDCIDKKDIWPDDDVDIMWSVEDPSAVLKCLKDNKAFLCGNGVYKSKNTKKYKKIKNIVKKKGNDTTPLFKCF